MTTLSEYLLKDRCVEYADSILIELDSAGSVAYPASRRVMFHLVLEGAAVVRLDATGQTVELDAGEHVLLFYGNAHSIHGSPTPSNIPPHIIEKFESGDEPGLLKVVHGGACSARLISSALSLVHAVPIRAARPMPDMLPAKALRRRAILRPCATYRHGASRSRMSWSGRQCVSERACQYAYVSGYPS